MELAKMFETSCALGINTIFKVCGMDIGDIVSSRVASRINGGISHSARLRPCALP